MIRSIDIPVISKEEVKANKNIFLSYIFRLDTKGTREYVKKHLDQFDSMVLEESGINRIVLYNIDPEIAFNFAIIVNQMDHLDALGICSIYEELKNKGFKSLNSQDVNEIKTYYNIYKRCYKKNISKEESNIIKEEFIREVQKVDPLFGTKEEKRMNNLMN